MSHGKQPQPNAAHTPGPWHTSRDMLFDVWADAPTQQHPRAIFKILQQTRGRSDDEIEANARLIAAAPELLAACQLFTKAAHDARDVLNGAGLACPSSIAFAAERARAALAKTGDA